MIDPATGADVPAGAVGELVAKGPGVTAGYYNKPEATAAAFTADGWLRTGDLGRIDADGYITLVGRSKESYRCGGEQVLPTEIEDLLTTHPEVLQAHVVPVPDARMGEVGVAFVVVQPGAQVSATELTALVAGAARPVQGAAAFALGGRGGYPDDRVGPRAQVPARRAGGQAAGDEMSEDFTAPETKVAIVTGGARGIGAAIALRLARDGHDVAVVDLDEAACADTVAAVRAAGRRAAAFGADVSDEAAVATAVAGVAEALGPPVVLVNNAGVLRDRTLAKMTLADWEVVMAVNLRAAFLTSRAVQPLHARRPLGAHRQPVQHRRARRTGRGELCRRQGGRAGLHQDAGDRTRPLRRSPPTRWRPASSRPR